jgi:hypothetical protein
MMKAGEWCVLDVDVAGKTIDGDVLVGAVVWDDVDVADAVDGGSAGIGVGGVYCNVSGVDGIAVENSSG